MRVWLYDWIGWLFCELAFRSWDWAGERVALVGWYASPSYHFGCWAYGRSDKILYPYHWNGDGTYRGDDGATT
jgi:hypothetical protein